MIDESVIGRTFAPVFARVERGRLRAFLDVLGRVFVDWCVGRMIEGDLDTVMASTAKFWCSDKQFETADVCLQLHGGYGYMKEYAIARRFVDARVQMIYGGTNEIMKVLIARSL